MPQTVRRGVAPSDPRTAKRRCHKTGTKTILPYRTGESKRTAAVVQPLPKDESWFETTWAAWQSGQIFREG